MRRRKKTELIVILPAYNEEQNVEGMLETWGEERKILRQQYGLQLKIVVVNDGSRDKTKEICMSLIDKNENITLVNHERNKGLGAAIKSGILFAIEKCPNRKYICIMDCDNTQNPHFILDMIDKVEKGRKKDRADVVIASRYQKGAKVEGVANYRIVTSQGARLIYGLLFHVKNVKDYTCGYRLYTGDILERGYSQYGTQIIEELGFSCMPELLYKLHCIGAKFEEIPFILRYDKKQGPSKMEVLKTAKSSVLLAFRLKKFNGMGKREK